jgi:hypothetical protein
MSKLSRSFTFVFSLIAGLLVLATVFSSGCKNKGSQIGVDVDVDGPIFDVTPAERSLSSGTVSSIVYLQVPTDGATFERARWKRWTRAALISNHVPLRNVELRRLEVDGTWLSGPGWGIRAYDCIDWTVEDVLVRDVLGPRDTDGDGDADKYVGEHPWYLNVAGNVTLRRCRMERAAGQAFQSVFLGRANESSNYELYKDAGGTIRLEDCHAVDCGLANPDHSQNGRASFAFSFFPSSQDVVVQRCSIDNTGNTWWSKNPSDPLSPRWNSYGGLMAQGHPTVRLEDLEVELDNPDRELVQLRDCGEVWLIGGRLVANGGRRKVSIDRCPRIFISGVESNADLYVDGVKVGTVSAGFQR